MMRKLLYTVSILYGLLLTGCASGPSITIGTMMSNTVYARDCIGPNSKWRQGDPECRHMGEPVPQMDMRHYRVSESNPMIDKITCTWDGTVSGRTPEQVERLRRDRARLDSQGRCG
jgi:hypothetical protein